jgi:hypothetical protein
MSRGRDRNEPGQRQKEAGAETESSRGRDRKKPGQRQKRSQGRDKVKPEQSQIREGDPMARNVLSDDGCTGTVLKRKYCLES